MKSVATRTFGALLRRYRTDRGLTQEELAERAGLSVRGISDLERGVNRAPYAATIERLIEALELSTEDAEALSAAGSRRRGPAAYSTPASSQQLPIPPTPLVGREREEANIVHLLRWEGRRLITLTGTGGVGKTRLAVQVASTMAEEFRHGAVFVPLSAVRDPALVVSAIAGALGILQAGQGPLRESVLEYLSEREVLLVLDNFEHLTSGAPFVADLLSRSPTLKVLATSRTPLRLQGEQEVQVQPLVLPREKGAPGVDDALRSSAVALFVQRAQLARSEFALDGATVGTVVEICRRLDGLPLAIELAAARLKLLTPADLLARLSDAQQVLTGGARDLPVRQQAMRNTIAWSYDLLKEEEQTLFRRLAVFADGWTLEAAEAIGRDGNVLEHLGSLVDSGLVLARARNGDTVRFAMLETIRQYATERLSMSGERDAMLARQAEHFLDLAETAEPELTGREQDAWLGRLEIEHNNIRAVLDWLLERGDAGAALKLSGALWRFWVARGYLEEGQRRLESALAAEGGSPASRARALLGAGVLFGDVEPTRAETLLGESLTYYRELNDSSCIANVLMELGSVLHRRGEHERAVALTTESLTRFRQLGNSTMVGQVLNNLGNVAADTGDYERAALLIGEGLALSRQVGDSRAVAIALLSLGAARAEQRRYGDAVPLYTESLAHFRRLGDKDGAALALLNLGEVAVAQSHLPEAAGLLREGLTLAYEVGSARSIAYCLEGIARLDAARGRVETAACIWGAAEKLRERSGIPLPPAIQAVFEQDIRELRCHVGEERWTAAWRQGRSMSIEEAVVQALEREAVG